jgi:transcriptional regulator of NAD metabolism
MAKMEDVEKVVEKLSKEDRKELLHDFDHCVLMVNKFEETGKAEYYVRMKSACSAFLETLDKFERRAV